VKLRFKIQRYQSEAVDAVAGCFAGQPRCQPAGPDAAGNAAGNAEIALSLAQLLENIQAGQRARGLPVSAALAASPAAGPGTPNLDVEMETGTGKTYVYIKTIMELHKRYGWSRFIVVVPSVAIREGVRKSFEVTAEHFKQAYGSSPRAFSYSSSRLHELARFAGDPGPQVMIINIQAFNAAAQDSRRIYEVLDELQSRRPIDVISACRPVVIIDEPQRIGAVRSLAALARLSALIVLRYSATHRVEHNKVYRLGALDAYNQKLVKKIAVRGITVQGLAGSSAYLYLDTVETAAGAGPRARAELEVRTGAGIKRQLRLLGAGASLYEASGRLAAYQGLYVTGIDAARDVIELSSGDVIAAGQVTTDVTEAARRRIQIREVIRAHLAKERQLFPLGIKVLSLFFIDEVARYRDYGRADTRGEYARVFTQEYAEQVAAVLCRLTEAESATKPASRAYRDYLTAISVEGTHRGYFSVDRKTGRDIDGDVKRSGEEKGQSADADAYDLILRDKERLLSLSEPVRFVFSHSALREGWDNPNIFVMGMLKKSDSTVSRRQEIGRGLRLSVDSGGDRTDDPLTVHEINELTVVTDESYTAFVNGLQRELGDSPAGRPPPPADGRKGRPAGAGDGSRGPDDEEALAGRGAGGGSGPAGHGRLPAAVGSAELAVRCAAVLDERLQVGPLRYLVQHGALRPEGGPGGSVTARSTAADLSGPAASAPAQVRYDLIGELAVRTQLTRRTVASILRRVSPATFAKYRENPEQFMTGCARLITEQLNALMEWQERA
jgi:type III restriction enzyme